LQLPAVSNGPVGPQVDPGSCALLEGHWSQFQQNVERGTLMTCIKVIEIRPIR